MIKVLKVFPRNTRGSMRKVCRTGNYEGTLYKRSPYYVGAKLWDTMSVMDIDLPDIFQIFMRFIAENQELKTTYQKV